MSLCLGLELVLCRVSDAPLALLPVLEEVFWFAVAGTLVIEVPRLFPVRRIRPADLSGVLLGAAVGGLWHLALRFGLRPHSRFADLEPWTFVFPIVCAYAICFAFRKARPALLMWLVALQGLLVALGIWGLGCGAVPVARAIVLVALVTGLVGSALWRRSRRFVALAGVAIAVVPLGDGDLAEPRWSARGPVPSGPDVVLIVADTLRVDAAVEMRSYARLAGAGADLGPAQATAPWTLPSMGSVLSGCDVSRHGAARVAGGGYSALRDDVPLLAEQLADAGYDTAAVLARNPNVGRRYGFARGFAVFDFEGQALRPWSLFALWGNRTLPLLHQLAGRALEHTAVAWALGRRRFQGRSTGHELVARARWVLEHRRERPIFVWLHFMDPHLPYLRLPERDVSAEEFGRLNLLRHGRPDEDPWFDEQKNRELVRRMYLAEVSELDAALTELLDALGPEPPNGRLIVLTSDHGEEFWEHGGFEHGHSFHQEVTGVPLVIGGIEGGTASVESPASLTDLAPTILRAAGVEPAGCSGAPLGRGVDARALAVENLRYLPVGAGEGDPWEGWFAVREGPLYLHDRGGETRLFDLAADPGERKDIAASRPSDAARLRASRPDDTRHGPAVELGADEREALRALGYME